MLQGQWRATAEPRAHSRSPGPLWPEWIIRPQVSSHVCSGPWQASEGPPRARTRILDHKGFYGGGKARAGGTLAGRMEQGSLKSLVVLGGPWSPWWSLVVPGVPGGP